MKTTYVKDLAAGAQISDTFLLAEAKMLQARNGPYWSLTLQDASGRVEAKIWFPASQNYADLAPGQFVRAAGAVETFRDKPQINVQRLEALPGEDMDLAQFLPASVRDPKDMMAEMEALVRERIEHAPLRRLVQRILKKDDIRARLLNAPGAKTVHHAYVGGLLEHTLAVCKLCMAMADHYHDEVDPQVLLAAAVLHDLGKAWELGGVVAADYTDEGRLLGHISLGMEVLGPFFSRAKGLDEDLLLHLKHIILSHHGELEFGSPRRPKTREAFILHYADNLDAKMATIRTSLQDVPDGETGWSPYQRFLDRYLFQPRAAPQSTRSSKRDKGDNQCSLPLKA
jgi:3'-5' exoribonuclease